MTIIKKMYKDNRFILTSIIIVGFAITLSISTADRFPFNAQAAGKGKSTNIELRGGAAIEHLKQSGQYDSLLKALQIDPDFVFLQKLSDSEGAAGDSLGLSVAISGDTVVVGDYVDDIGANVDQGSAWVFVRSGNTWLPQQQLIAADGEASDLFGISVSISGDTIVVGAPQDDIGANADQGSAYVFVRSGTTWSQQQKLTAADGAANDWFGASVGVSGDTLVVGAFLDDIGANTDQGSAYILVRSGTTWSQQQKLIAADGAAGDRCASSVAISGDTVVVGDYVDDIGANVDQGSAYIFVRSGVTWSQQQKLTAADGAANDQFGVSVSISGDTVVVGAFLNEIGENTNQGSAYVFVRSGTSWSLQQKLIASDGVSVDVFGAAVAISGDTIVVGANGYAPKGSDLQGAAYVFVRSGTTWSQQQKLIAADGADGDRFGLSVAIDAETIMVGAFNDDIGVNANQGSAYMFAVGKAPTITCPANIMTSNTPGQCAANVTFNAATTGTPTPALTCLAAGLPVTSPANFPVGVTTVICTAANSVLPDASCSFPVTVVDTQPPVINCPQNVTAAAPVACPTVSAATVNYALPVATDNCQEVAVTCAPPGGSLFPVGATTVTCTAKDAANLTSQCSFTVKVFNVCVQDESDPSKVFLFNTETGEYYFCCSGSVINGIGLVTKRGCVYTLTHNSADRKVQAQVDLSLFRGTASLQKPVGTATCSLSDRDLRNNSCRCSV